MAALNLGLVDELIAARRAQHGGGVGAPPVLDGLRVGTSINQSCIVMLSANLQAYIGDVFFETSLLVFPKLVAASDQEKYKKKIGIWGNPNPNNISNLFTRIGIIDVLSGLSWQGMTNERLLKRLDNLNIIRNQIAHGRNNLIIDNKNYPLPLSQVENLRNFSAAFGNRFEALVRSKI